MTDIGELAEVGPDVQEDVDRPDLDAAGGDDSAVEGMLAAILEDPGPFVEESLA